MRFKYYTHINQLSLYLWKDYHMLAIKVKYFNINYTTSKILIINNNQYS